MNTPYELRKICGHDSFSVDGCVTCEAADEIESLRAKVAELEDKLGDELIEVHPDGTETWKIAKHESVEPVAVINVEARTLEWSGPVDWMVPATANLNKIPLYTHPPKHEAVEPVAWMVKFKRNTGIDSLIVYSRDRAEKEVDARLIVSVDPLYTQPPSTQAAVSAALRKAADVAFSELAVVDWGTHVRKAILAIPHDDSHLRELMIDAVIEAKIQFGTSMTNKAIVARVLKC
jgi:hypothetical protein